MFTSFLENSEKEIKITEVDGHAIKSLIQFLYTGRVENREDNVQELLETSHMLLLNNVVEACGKFLVEQLDPTNCLGFTFLAKLYSCQSLFESAEKYTLEHFVDVCKKQELNYEQLGHFLTNDNLCVTSEQDVFNSLRLWLEYDGCEREKYVDELLKMVRLTLLDPVNLYVHVKPMSVGRCFFRTAVLNKKLYAVGGLSSSNRLHSSEYYDSDQNVWISIGSMSEIRRGHGVAVANGILYAVGGFCNKSMEFYI